MSKEADFGKDPGWKKSKSYHRYVNPVTQEIHTTNCDCEMYGGNTHKVTPSQALGLRIEYDYDDGRCIVAMNTVCEECDREHPSDPEDLVLWFEKQALRLFNDELVYGCSYVCASCCQRHDPKDMVETPDEIWRIE